jgi:hypothetical protein
VRLYFRKHGTAVRRGQLDQVPFDQRLSTFQNRQAAADIMRGTILNGAIEGRKQVTARGVVAKDLAGIGQPFL